MASTTFALAGSVQQYIVPEETYILQVDVVGAAGTDDTFDGGSPAVVTGTLDVTPGEILWVAPGDSANASAPGVGGRNPAGFAYGGGPRGGAASMLGRGAVKIENAIVIAGGGGGGSADGVGGAGGGIGRKSTGYGGGGQGGGTDPTYTASYGESNPNLRCGGGGGGLVGGRAGTQTVAGGQNPGTKQGAGGGGSSRVPTTMTVESLRRASVTGSVTLTSGLPPRAPTITDPAPGSTLTANRDLAVRVAFAGASSRDSQSLLEVEVRVVGGETLAFSVLGAQSSVAVPDVAVPVGTLELRARTASQSGAVGPYSPWAAYPVVEAPPDPDVTTPATGAAITSTTLSVEWVAAEQAAFRVRTTSLDGLIAFTDSGVVEDAAPRSYVVPLAINDRAERVEVSVRGVDGGWSRGVTRRYRTNWARPSTPVVTVECSAPPGADRPSTLLITVTNPAETGRPAATTNVVRVHLPGVVERISDPLPASSTPTPFRWWVPAANTDYVVAVTAVAASGATAVGTASHVSVGGWGVGPWGAAPWGS